MFTVLSDTRNSNLFLIAALAIVVITLLTLAFVPAISAPQPALAPASRLSEAGSDYYQRHSEARVSMAPAIGMDGDFYLRHPEWTSNVQNVSIPGTGISEAVDYFQRHHELSAAAPLLASPETPGMACESPVDCR